jgi:hypothetical protein
MYNKRIQELAEQAGYKHPDAVGKCEDYAYFEVSDLMDYEGEGVDLATLRFVRRIIKEHFGVEE